MAIQQEKDQQRFIVTKNGSQDKNETPINMKEDEGKPEI